MEKISREQTNGITQDYLKEHFEYKDGLLARTSGDVNKTKKNKGIWSKHSGGYQRVVAKGKGYSVSRLIWIYHYGDIPYGMKVDHINRVRDDNRIENMRLATIRENNMNCVRNTSGFPGVSWCSTRKKWAAYIKVNGVGRTIGRYDTLEEAVEARRNAERELGIEVREEFFRAS